MIKQVKKVDTKLCYASSFVKRCVCANTQDWEECAKITLEEIYQIMIMVIPCRCNYG